jgi:hypothetical protein
MRSEARARYESALMQMARGARRAAELLEEVGAADAAEDYLSLHRWLQSELDASLKNKPPLKGQISLLSSKEASLF